MGRPMASHLAAAGHAITLYDIAPRPGRRRRRDARRRGRARTPAALAAGSDIVITMVPNGAVVHELVDGDRGLLQGLRPGTLLLDTSSSEPWLTERSGRLLAERRRGDGRRAGFGRAVGRRGRRARLHVRRRRGRHRARPAAARRHGQGGVPSRPARRRPRDEVPQQPDHGDELARRDRGPGDRQALRPRSVGDGRRPRPVDRRVVGLAAPTSASASSAAASTTRSSSRSCSRTSASRCSWRAAKRAGAALGRRPGALARRRLDAAPDASVSELARWVEKLTEDRDHPRQRPPPMRVLIIGAVGFVTRAPKASSAAPSSRRSPLT